MVPALSLALEGDVANQRFEEIDVERINVIEPDGTLRLTLSNRKRSPDPMFEGTPHDRTGQREAGLIFFTDDGVECGGIAFGRRDGEMGASLTFDRYGQDQTVFLSHGERNGVYESGLLIIDRPSIPLVEQADEIIRAQNMPDGPEKQSEMQRLSEGVAVRVSIGRGADGTAGLHLMDSKGKPRIKLYVGADDEPRLEFLDADGNVTKSF